MLCATKALTAQIVTTAWITNDYVVVAHLIHDETQIITAAHEVSKSYVRVSTVSRECSGFIKKIFTEPVIVQWPSV